MRKKDDKKKFARPKARLGLPDLDQSKAAAEHWPTFIVFRGLQALIAN